MAASKRVSELEDHVGYWLRFVSNHVSDSFKRKVEAQGVTVAEWVLLRELLRSGPANPSHLAAELGMTRGAVSKLVERLRQKKLAVRAVAAGDRRYQRVGLTAAGKKLVPILARLADENDGECFGYLAAERKTSLVKLLKDMVRRHGWKGAPVN